MKFSIKHKTTKEIIITVDYKNGENKWLLAINAALKIKADLSSADLSSADLRYANLRYADLSSADLSSADLSSADLSYANLRSANLSFANLRYANLSYANLSYANLDFSSGIPFYCGSFGVKVDIRIMAQMAYHFCKLDAGDCKESKAAQMALKELANKFHRVDECGKIE
jgi:hypothetical protein